MPTLTIASLLLAAALASPEAPLTLRLPKEAPHAAGTLFAEAFLGSGHEAVTAHAEWGDRKATLHPEAGGRVPILLAVPLEARGSIRLSVNVQADDGGVRTVALDVPIDPPDSSHKSERWELKPETANVATAANEEAERREIEGRLAVAERRVRLFRDDFERPVRGSVHGGFGTERRLGSSTHGGLEAPLHRGIDIGARAGSRVLAPADGVVLAVLSLPLLGETVLVDHGIGVVSIVGHLESAVVRTGDTVGPQSVLGFAGETGLVPDTLVHYGIFVHGEAVDPESFRHLPSWLKTTPAAAPSATLAPERIAATASAASAPGPSPVTSPSPLPSPSPAPTSSLSTTTSPPPPPPSSTPTPPPVARAPLVTAVATPPLPDDFSDEELAVLLGRGLEARLAGSRVVVTPEREAATKKGRVSRTTYTVLFEELGANPFLTAVETTAFVAGELTSRSSAKTGRLTVIDARSGGRVVLQTSDARQLWRERIGIATPIPRSH